MEPVYIDLGDIVPEEYEISFQFGGKPYLVRYPEASVDDVFRLLWDAQQQGKDGMAQQRYAVAEFLKKYLAEGDPAGIDAIAAALPFQSQRGGLDIQTLVDKIKGRVKKNEPGAATSPTP